MYCLADLRVNKLLSIPWSRFYKNVFDPCQMYISVYGNGVYIKSGVYNNYFIPKNLSLIYCTVYDLKLA